MKRSQRFAVTLLVAGLGFAGSTFAHPGDGHGNRTGATQQQRHGAQAEGRGQGMGAMGHAPMAQGSERQGGMGHGPMAQGSERQGDMGHGRMGMMGQRGAGHGGAGQGMGHGGMGHGGGHAATGSDAGQGGGHGMMGGMSHGAGEPLFSPAERQKLREQMGSATTAEERDRVAQAHREAMSARTAERGAATGSAQGPGAGRGMGRHAH